MEVEQVLENLKRARRALDALTQVTILDDWTYDDNTKVWFLHLSINIPFDSVYFPHNSFWYVTAESKYPKGSIKIYPDINNSITSTLYHQSNNSKVEKNGLWRKGNLCLDVNTLPVFQSEPKSIDGRLFYNVKRAINWLELAAQNKLVTNVEPFELPEFTLSKLLEIQFAFSEDIITFMQWESTECKYGIAELDVYKSNPFIYYVKKFKSLDGNIVHYTQWGAELLKVKITPPIVAPWILLDKLPVVNEWQAPETLEDLIEACGNQNIDLMSILKKLTAKIRDGKQHLFLIGFPIPFKFGGEPETICWKALYLPILSHGKYTAKGFRPNQYGWWLRDKNEILTNKMELNWLVSENWNQQEISKRGKMDNALLRKSVLILGAGCVGSSIAEIFVRAGIYNLSIADSDIFNVGNLSRHVLNINSIGGLKESCLCNHLNSLSPNATVDVINKRLSVDSLGNYNIDLEKFDVIIDCTGENEVLEALETFKFTKPHTVASVSVGLGAKRLYIAICNGTCFTFGDFLEFISPYIKSDMALYDDYELPRDGIGCWHPTFPGRSDDVWMAAATSVKAIENYITSSSQKSLFLVYEQNEENKIFESFHLAIKKEVD